MKTVMLISIILFISSYCVPCRAKLDQSVQIDSIQENEIYINFSHDSIFLSYYFSDPEGIQDQIIDSVVIEVPKYGKSLKVVTDRSPIHSRLFLNKTRDRGWTETDVVIFFWKDELKTDKYELKL